MVGDEDFQDAMRDVAPLDERQVRKGELLDRQRQATVTTPETITPAQLEKRLSALGIERQPRVDPNPLSLGEVPPVAPRDVLEWKKDGVQHQVFSRLRNGRYPIDGALDLHRLTVREAREAVFRFFRLAEARSWRTVLIAHGRGEQSETPARLKSYVARWLRELPHVIAFASADARHGGTGAVLVLLRKSQAAKGEARERYGGRAEADDG